MNVDEILFRASSMGDIQTTGTGEITPIQLETIGELTEKRTKKPLTKKQEEELKRLIEKRDNPELSETTKKRLIKIFAFEHYGRTEDITSKYLEKGVTMEENAITLYSLVKKKFFKKNEERLYNKFTTGLPDLWDGEREIIQDAEEIIDIKSSWSLITFLNAKIDKKINHDYKWQGNTYLYLVPTAKRFRLAYCLVNSPAKLILDEKRKIQNQLGFIDPDMADQDEQYKERCRAIERNHIFDLGLFREHSPHFDFHNDINEWKWDIPKEKRVHEFVFARNIEEIAQIPKRGIVCRKWIKDNLMS